MKQMRKNALRLAALFCALFAAVSAYAVYIVSSNEARLMSSTYNTYAREQRARAVRGDILDRNGVVLATSDSEDHRTYHADPQVRAATAHAVGVNSYRMASSADYMFSAYLYGLKLSFPERLSYMLQGKRTKGDNVRLTIDSRLSVYAASRFPADKKGAIVVMNYQTGELLVLQSFPSFDPQDESSLSAARTSNYATGTKKAPGSTFKIVTAASAMQNFPDFAEKTYVCEGVISFPARPVVDAGTRLAEGTITRHGQTTMQHAFAVSCNNTFAQIALELGDEALRKTAEDFGFNDNFLFSDLVVENSAYPAGQRADVDVAWTGVGQSSLAVTPLHMCMIASTVANDGVMMEPRTLKAVTAQSGRQRMGSSPRVYRRPLSVEQAAVLKDYMRAVVTAGTGRSAAIEGKKVCGKTGSAELDNQEKTNAWFVGFLDEPDAPYAVAVVVENAGGGGSVAAPIARALFAWLLENDVNGEEATP
ncbi:MAG: hypothetical protein IKP32_03945 [Clostridia bacterium]|nr:hypothetical protein [Clostridia bacterium]